MKITFCSLDKYWGGLSTNGGSRTILKSAETLRKMGHKVNVVAPADKFTWFKHPRVLKKIPKDTDVCIAIAITDIKPMLKKAPKQAKLGYWGRPPEFWQLPEKKCKKILNNFDGVIMFNSTWPKEWLGKGKVIYNGMDFEDWKDLNLERKYVGCLYSDKKRKRYKDCVMMQDLIDEQFFKIGLENETSEELCRNYNLCKIWFAPTELEGFHNVPSEAALCGCVIVCSMVSRNGCMDYCTPETAHIYDRLDDAIEMIKKPDYSKVPKMQKLIKDKIKTREYNMKKLVRLFC